MTKIVKVLSRAKELITQGWTQEFFARDKNRTVCHSASKNAVCFCLLGAIKRANREFKTEYRDELIIEDRLINFLKESPASWNDAPERTKDDVLSLLSTLILQESQV